MAYEPSIVYLIATTGRMAYEPLLCTSLWWGFYAWCGVEACAHPRGSIHVAASTCPALSCIPSSLYSCSVEEHYAIGGGVGAGGQVQHWGTHWGMHWGCWHPCCLTPSTFLPHILHLPASHVPPSYLTFCPLALIVHPMHALALPNRNPSYIMIDPTPTSHGESCHGVMGSHPCTPPCTVIL